MEAFHRHHGAVPVLAAVLGHRLDSGRHGRLAEGPLRLAVLTPDAIISADPETGRTIGTRAITDMAGYYADEHGRVLVRYHEPNTSFPLVAAFAPLALHGAPELSARAAGFTLLRRMIDAWEHHTGQPFINTWAGQLRLTETD